MRRLTEWGRDQVLSYNLRDGGTAVSVFEETQTSRVHKARELIDTILLDCPPRAAIIEPGCSAGDISGPYANDHEVRGIDVVPAAVDLARERYPAMTVELAAADEIEPAACDILVLCEFLEHITDPIGFVERWLPKANYVIIGHPLVGNGTDPEPGHVWAYTDNDFRAWFGLGGHEAREAWEFEMAGYRMVIGWGRRR